MLDSNRTREDYMARGNASGRRVKAADVPIIIGMIARGDRHHDIAAWFGFNQGRIAETQGGKYGPPQTNPGLRLPPKGPPGLKGQKLRDAANSALSRLNAGDNAGGIAKLQDAIKCYDADEA
jgi:hypothetical protein